MLSRLKKTFYYLLPTFALITVFAAIATAQNDESVPTLRGDEAIEQLKKNGQFDSLQEAIKAARKDDAQTDEPTDDVIVRTARLTASDSSANDYFGNSISMSGDTVIIGTWGDDVGANVDQGSAYVFVRSNGVWTEPQKLTSSDGAASDYFGWSVGIYAETIVVGALNKRVDTNNTQGAAYVFVRSDGIWTEQQKLIASDGEGGDKFGNGIAISGDTVIVGAPDKNNFRGAAYVFVRQSNVWNEQRKLTASNGATYDSFGWSIAVSGNSAVIGAYGCNIGANGDQGGVYIFASDLVPTAAGVSISGRVLTENGAGLRNATVTIRLQNGETRTVNTGSFGYYQFDDIDAGQTIPISVSSKTYRFNPQIINTNQNLTDINFIASQ